MIGQGLEIVNGNLVLLLQRFGELESLGEDIFVRYIGRILHRTDVSYA